MTICGYECIANIADKINNPRLRIMYELNITKDFTKIMGLELYHLQYALLTLMNAKAIGKAASNLQLLPH